MLQLDRFEHVGIDEIERRHSELVGWFPYHRTAVMQDGQKLLGVEARLDSAGGVNVVRGVLARLDRRDDKSLYLALLACRVNPAIMQDINNLVQAVDVHKSMQGAARGIILENSSLRDGTSLFRVVPDLTYIIYNSSGTPASRLSQGLIRGYLTTPRGIERLASFA